MNTKKKLVVAGVCLVGAFVTYKLYRKYKDRKDVEKAKEQIAQQPSTPAPGIATPGILPGEPSPAVIGQPVKSPPESVFAVDYGDGRSVTGFPSYGGGGGTVIEQGIAADMQQTM